MKITNEFKVGIIAVIAMVVLFLGFNYLKGNNIFASQKSVTIRVDRVNGLTKSNPVLLYGLQVGAVDDIIILDPSEAKNIEIKFHVRPDVTIPNTSLAKVISKDILGAMAIELFPEGTGQAVKSGDTLRASVQSSITESITTMVDPIQARLNNLLVSVDTAIHALNIVFNNKTRRSLQNSFLTVEQTLSHLNNTSIEVENLSKREAVKLSKIMANFESISTNLKNNDKAITHAINNFSDISDSLKQANLKHTILEVNKAVTDLAVIMDKIEKGEGTVGQLLNNKQMYMNLESASKNMDALIIDLKAHPKRYVHFSVFGGKKDKASK